jgi:hypothetical protein
VEHLVESITNGHVTAVKIVLTSVVATIALYQVFLMTVGYGKLRLPFLASRPASRAHRAIGDAAVTVAAIVGLMCLAYFGIEDGLRETAHIVLGFLLFGVLAFKIAVLRWWHRLSGLLPYLGVSVLILFVLTWGTSAGAFL